ncbi:hypothetical protein J3459_014033 [Metarhizium acridum]|nr:hypothetical protein J3459_014033 [Metarhizium acridum]
MVQRAKVHDTKDRAVKDSGKPKTALAIDVGHDVRHTIPVQWIDQGSCIRQATEQQVVAGMANSHDMSTPYSGITLRERRHREVPGYAKVP